MKISLKRFMWLQRRAILGFAVSRGLDLECAAGQWISGNALTFRAAFRVGR